MQLPPVIDIATLRALYESKSFGPAALCAALNVRMDNADPAIFINRSSAQEIATQIDALLAKAPDPNSLPLWGVPYVIKDNIDVAGVPTTAACPDFSYIAEKDAYVVARLRAAGAIMLGKTNLDQFATGLNGTRSPFGAPRSVFDADYISGGSSSGSAVAVAAGLACFSLGTDTAGSGRVPAAFNNIVGIKPTSGLLSTTGVVPACRSLDCVSIFALNVADGACVRRIAEGLDPADAYSRCHDPKTLPIKGLRVGVLAPSDREFFGNKDGAELYQRAIDSLCGTIVEIDFAPFREIAALLYQGPWVAERLAAFGSFGLPLEAMEPTVAEIISAGAEYSAVDAFRGCYQLEELKRLADREWAKVDVLLLPTAPTIYRVNEMLANPIGLNNKLGRYTNFFNFLNLSAIAVPAGFRSDGLPFGVTLAGRPFCDEALEIHADRIQRAVGGGAGIDRAAILPVLPISTHVKERLQLVVVGAHLSGMALNHELLDLGAMLIRQTRTASDYRLFVLPQTTPAKPGMVRTPGYDGQGIEVEIWSLDAAEFGRFVEHIPQPLGIGKITLADGDRVSGFLCENAGLEGATEITHFGGWRAYMASHATVT